MAKPAPSRVAAALDYLERLKNQAAEFGGGVVENLADRARSVGGLAYEALTSDPAIGRMTTAEYAQAADRPTPRLDQAARDIGTIGRAIVTQPIQTGKAIVQGEVERAREAMSSPRAAGQYAGSFIDPIRMARMGMADRAPQRIAQALEAAPSKAAKVEPQPFGLQGYLDDDLRRVKQNFFSQYGLEEGKQFSKDYEVIELSKLKPTENTNESKIQSLMKTMREEGNAKDNPIPPIIVDSEGNILDGHHRYEAAKRLGAKYVPVVELFDKQKGPSFSE